MQDWAKDSRQGRLVSFPSPLGGKRSLLRYLARLERRPDVGLNVRFRGRGPDALLHVLDPAEDLLVGEAVKGA